MLNIEKCRICGNKELVSLFDLGDQRLTGVFPSSPAQSISGGPVELVKCRDESGCGLVQLRQSYDLSDMYGLNYGYRSGLNPSMVKHLASKIEKILGMGVLVEGDLVIDIGSNDATSLKVYPQDKYTLVGVDPTGVKFSSYYPESIQLISDFFAADLLRGRFPEKRAKVITSFSMFYDLEDPVRFAQEVSDCLDPNGIWVFEQSYLPAMLRTNSFDTICHEHLEFYSLKQIIWIADKVGLKVLDVEFNDVNGGSFSIIAARKESNHLPKTTLINQILEDEEKLGISGLAVFEQFKARVHQEMKQTLEFLSEQASLGKTVVGLGASTKGNVLLQYYGIGPELLTCIGEVNEEKFGCFTPGSNIPLIPEAEAIESEPDYLFILPWHFRSFFMSLDKLKDKKLVFPLPKFEIVEL